MEGPIAHEILYKMHSILKLIKIEQCCYFVIWGYLIE